MIKVSVIIPIYKVEKYIARCIHSLMRQTLQDVEYIFVNDCTPDDSIRILNDVVENYPYRKNRVKVISHERNKGLPSARNTGLLNAAGEYIFHCDSDDWIEINMLEELYVMAMKNNADIVWCDWFLSFMKKERYMKQPKFVTSDEALKGILVGEMKYNVWNKLVKRALYTNNSIVFPDGHGMGEDMTMIRLFAYAQKVAYVPQAFYHYVKLNGEAFTNTYSEQHLIDIYYNANLVKTFLEERYGNRIEKEIAYFMLNTKFPFLISDNKLMYQTWRKWFPEVNKYILANKSLSIRSRLIQYMASKGQFWIVWLYYKVIYKFVYGIIYR